LAHAVPSIAGVRQVLAAALLSVTACAHIETSGSIATDGRIFGLHSGSAICGVQDGRVRLTFPLQGRVPDGYVLVGPNAPIKGVDLYMPWSHATFAPRDCTVFDIRVDRDPDLPALT
jgi:hypothetical protein